MCEAGGGCGTIRGPHQPRSPFTSEAADSASTGHRDVPHNAAGQETSGSSPGMTRHDAGVLALRIMAVYCWAQLLQLVTMIMPIPIAWGGIATVQYAVVCAIYIAGGCLLFRYADTLAGFMLPGAPDAPARVNASGKDLQMIAFSVIGVFMAIGAIPALLTYIVTLFVKTRADQGFMQGPYIWATFGRLVLAVGLFVGGPGVSRFWDKVRTWGVQMAP